MSDQPSAPPSRRNTVLQILIDTYPVFGTHRPLAIGIHKTLKARQPELADGALRLALRLHTTATKYLKAVANGSQRFDLDGNPAGEITAEQKAQALAAIKERFRKGAERKREAEQEKLQQEKAEKQRQKLQQLADKFSKR
jgi:ProP effector